MSAPRIMPLILWGGGEEEQMCEVVKNDNN